jgi:hypothetical protein
MVLDGKFPRFVLIEAVRRVLQGCLGHNFFPSPPELFRLCENIMAPYYAEEQRIKRRQAEAAENDERARIMARSTPESRRRVQELTDGVRAWKSDDLFPHRKGANPKLDQELVGLLPDRPSTFKKAPAIFCSASALKKVG